MTSRDAVRVRAEHLGFSRETSLLDIWTDVFRRGNRQVEISYSRTGTSVLSVWTDYHGAWRTPGRPGALEALETCAALTDPTNRKEPRR